MGSAQVTWNREMKLICHRLLGDNRKGPSLTQLPPLHHAAKIYPSLVMLGQTILFPFLSPFREYRQISHTLLLTDSSVQR